MRRTARRRIGAAEALVGAAICLLLSGVVVAVVIKAGRFDRYLYDFDPRLLAGRAAPSAGLGESDAPSHADLLPKQIGTDLRRTARPEFFTADRLHLKIDGRDEAYIAFNVVSLTFCAYGSPRLGRDEIQVFVYDMGQTINAAGMCRKEYAAGAEPAGVGDGGYRAGGCLFFWSGPLLIEIITAGQTSVHQQAVMQIAEAIVRARHAE